MLGHPSTGARSFPRPGPSTTDRSSRAMERPRSLAAPRFDDWRFEAKQPARPLRTQISPRLGLPRRRVRPVASERTRAGPPRRRVEAREDLPRPRPLYRAFLGRDGDARDGGQPHGRRAQIQREHLHRSVPRATRRAAVPGRLVRPPRSPRASPPATDVPFLPRAPPALPSATNNGKPSAPA